MSEAKPAAVAAAPDISLGGSQTQPVVPGTVPADPNEPAPAKAEGDSVDTIEAAEAEVGNPQDRDVHNYRRSIDDQLLAVRASLKRRLAGVRALLPTASNGDHRATVTALSGIANLLHEMLGPDTPPDSLRGALADLAAGRDDDARTALTAARTVLASGPHGVFDPAELEEIDGTIGGALLALDRGDGKASAMLAQTALDLIDAAD